LPAPDFPVKLLQRLGKLCQKVRGYFFAFFARLGATRAGSFSIFG
jgi:hypothetical protein